MSLRDFFSRSKEAADVVIPEAKSKNEIACDTAELKKLITQWTRNEGWEFENFADFIKLVGVKPPVKLSGWDKESYSFKCVTALDTEIRISILFGRWFDSCSEIHITEGEETRCYITNSNSEKGKSVPEVTLQRRNVKRYGKELNSFYCDSFCERTLKLDDTHVLEVKIDEPDKYEKKSEIFVLRNCKDIEEYLMGLDTSLVIAEVYEKLMELLNFSNEDISKCESISIAYIETVEKEEQVRGKVFLTKGKMQEYAIFEKGETFHLFEDGSWRYLSDSGISIVYSEKMKHHVFSITGTKDSIINANPREIFHLVEVKISKLWKFVR